METCKYEHLRIGFKPWAPNANHATTIPPFIAEDSTSDIMKKAVLCQRTPAGGDSDRTQGPKSWPELNSACYRCPH